MCVAFSCWSVPEIISPHCCLSVSEDGVGVGVGGSGLLGRRRQSSLALEPGLTGGHHHVGGVQPGQSQHREEVRHGELSAEQETVLQTLGQIQRQLLTARSANLELNVHIGTR